MTMFQASSRKVIGSDASAVVIKVSDRQVLMVFKPQLGDMLADRIHDDCELASNINQREVLAPQPA